MAFRLIRSLFVAALAALTFASVHAAPGCLFERKIAPPTHLTEGMYTKRQAGVEYKYFQSQSLESVCATPVAQLPSKGLAMIFRIIQDPTDFLGINARVSSDVNMMFEASPSTISSYKFWGRWAEESVTGEEISNQDRTRLMMLLTRKGLDGFNTKEPTRAIALIYYGPLTERYVYIHIEPEMINSPEAFAAWREKVVAMAKAISSNVPK